MPYVLVPVSDTEETDSARPSAGMPVELEDVQGPVLTFTENGLGESFESEFRESTDLVEVSLGGVIYLLPADMPVAVSGGAGRYQGRGRAVDVGLDLSDFSPALGWIPARDLEWNDGVFWAPDVEASGSVDGEPEPARLRWLSLVTSVEPVKPGRSAKSMPRLQVLTAPSYFMASGEKDAHGILVSGVTDYAKLPEPSGASSSSEDTKPRRRKR